jgi:hypothetical protein
MKRLEVSCRKFAVLSGIRQDADDYAVCIAPRPANLQRRGILALITEPAGAHPSLSTDACRLVRDAIARHYYADASLSLTGSLLNALDEANSALLEHNHGGYRCNYNYNDHGYSYSHNYPPSDTPHSPGAGPAAATVAVRAGGVKTRRVMVGLTAVLLKADGTGVYIAQAAPTQAYIVHNGLLSAIPEPPDWHTPAPFHRHQHENGRAIDGSAGDRGDGAEAEGEDNLIVFRRAGQPDEQSPEGLAPFEGATEDPAHAAGVPAPPLGSGPGVEADLIYRRVGPGDLIVMVSTSLARHLDRLTAEALFSMRDADAVVEGLFHLATERGLAEAHACVLQLGVEAQSGVEDFTAGWSSAPRYEHEREHEDPLEQQAGDNTTGTRTGAEDGSAIAADGGASPQASYPAHAHTPSRASHLMRWISALTMKGSAQPASGAHFPPPLAPDIAHNERNGRTERNEHNGHAQPLPLSREVAELEQPAQAQPHRHPTETLLAHTVDVPPFLKAEGDLVPAHAMQEHEIDRLQEPEFDGWEDLPPALRRREQDPAVLASDTEQATGEPDAMKPPPHTLHAKLYSVGALDQPSRRSPAPPVAPALFDPSDDEQDEGAYLYPPTYAQDTPQSDDAVVGGVRTHPFMPDLRSRLARIRVAPLERAALRRPLSVPLSVIERLRASVPRILPVRLVIGLALLLVGALLLASVLSLTANQKQGEVAALLRQAQQEDTLANAPGITPAEKERHLVLALQKAREALSTDPESAEARRTVSRLQADLDRAQGITRMTAVKLLFDLDEADRLPTGARQTASSATPAVPTANDPITTTAQAHIAGVVVQGNDAYILDRQKNSIYRCRISTGNCTVVLNAGDSAGGQKVGRLVGMTLRVGNLVALDDRLVAYVFDADTSAWQAQPLGDADKLDLPADVDSYDGNLYLLGAKPAQISKYFAGRYGEPPQDWITDPATLEQVKDPVGMAIDGHIYLLLGDGTVLVMQGGKVIRTITPEVTGMAEPSELFTSTETRDLYILRSADGTITRLSKEGRRIGRYKAPADNETLATIDTMTIDEGRGSVYLVRGRHIYQARLTAPAGTLDAPAEPDSTDQPAQPGTRPVAEP